MKIKTSKSEGIGEVVFERPPVNALGKDDMQALAAAVTDIGRDDDVRVVILYGEGRCFCAGIDIKELAAAPETVTEYNRAAYALFEAIHICPVPVIAAVRGYAVGAGAAMIGASDITFVADDAKVGLPEIKVGMLGGASHMLRVLPLPKVRSMFFTGEPIDADEMYRLGAAEAVVPSSDLLEVAHEFAGRIAANNATGLRFAKEALNGIEPVRLEKNYRYEQGFTFEISHLDAGRDARSAFAAGKSQADTK